MSIPNSILKDFFHDFHLMLASGMPITQVLVSLEETISYKSLKMTINQVSQSISKGESLVVALRQTQQMPWIVMTTIQAAENSGMLVQVMFLLSCYFKQADILSKKLQQALTYPLIVMVILIGLMLFITLSVVPKLKPLLPEDALNNQTTQILLILSGFFQAHGISFLITLAVLCLGGLWWVKDNRTKWEETLLNVPLVGTFIKEGQLSVYMMNLSILLKSGVPLLKSIDDLNGSESSMVSYKFYESRQYIFGGLSLWESLRQDKFFPQFLIFSIRRGEELGCLDEYCLKLSEYYQDRLNNRLEQMITFLQPVLLAVGGALLMIIGLSFLLPIYGNLTQIAGGG